MPKMFPTSIDLPQEVRERMVALLNQQLANLFDLRSQTKQAHWNVKGPQFAALHELFDRLALDLDGYMDAIAERATALGGLAAGTARMAAATSRLEDLPPDVVEGQALLKALVTRYAQVAAGLRAAIAEAEQAGDAGTADLFTEVVRGLDKALWFLEAHIQA